MCSVPDASQAGKTRLIGSGPVVIIRVKAVLLFMCGIIFLLLMFSDLNYTN